MASGLLPNEGRTCFALLHGRMDLCFWGLNHDPESADVAIATGLAAAQVERTVEDIRCKLGATADQHA